MSIRSGLRFLMLFIVVVAPLALSAAETSICEIRCGYDRGNIIVSGSVDDLLISHSENAGYYANFDIRDEICEVHIYWDFPGSSPTWLRNGAYVEVRGRYEEYNRVYGGPEILADQVALAFPSPSPDAETITPSAWTLIPWGAASEVAGSCYQLTTASSSILVDCGSFMNNDDMPSSGLGDHLDCEAFPFDPRDINAVIITHAHDDHIGRLHYLVAQGFSGPIYMTRATAVLYRAKLDDTLYYSCLHDMRVPSARRAMQDRIESMLVEYGYLERFPVAEGVYATFVDAGHIPGSASIIIDLRHDGETETVVFSGDLGSGHHPFLNAPDLEFLSTVTASTLVVESTYGASGPREYPDDLYGDFYAAVQGEISRHHLVVIPTFALDRTQRVLAALIHGVNSGRLTIDKPIGVGGKSSYYQTLEYMQMQSQPTEFGQYFSDAFFSNSTFDGQGSTWKFVRRSVSDSSNETPGNAWKYSVIVTPSGTGSSSYAKTLIDAYGESDDVTFLQVGWAPDTSPLGELLDSGHLLSIKEVKDVFSGHAGISQLVEYVDALPSLERVIITHGDDPLGARAALESAICQQSHDLRILRPRYGEVIDLLDQNLGCSCEDTQFCSSAECVSASSASEYEGEYVWVCGQVASTRRLDSGLTFLNLEHPYPNQDFTVMIESRRISTFDLALGELFHEDLVGRLICVYGLVSDYEGTPQIIPTEPSQIWSAEFGVAIPGPCKCED